MHSCQCDNTLIWSPIDPDTILLYLLPYSYFVLLYSWLHGSVQDAEVFLSVFFFYVKQRTIMIQCRAQ